jgi:glucosylceramidase
MKNEQSRRDFLKISTTGMAALAASPWALSPRAAAADAPQGAIQVWTTAGDKRHASGPALQWRAAMEHDTDSAIILRAENKFQEILGFGCAFTDAACYMFNQLSSDARAQLFRNLFHASEMNLNVCRTCIGSSDYATKVYSYDEGEPDPELTRFSITHDREYILPILREARKVNPDIFLFSSPWSPPGWMKANNSMLGGSMRRKYMPSYAEYFLKFLKAYEADGVPVQAITIQNEVDTDQDGRMPACIWPQEYEADFIRQNLGPLFEKEGIQTKIWIVDHNYNLWGRAIGELETDDVKKYVSGTAWHGYVGRVEWLDRVHEAFPDVDMFWTEGGPDYTMPDYHTDWSRWSSNYTGILRHWCRSITGWNLALDEKGRPNIGPFPCGGLVTIDSQSKEITYSGQYWCFAHYSRHVRRGARRLDTQGGLPGVEHVAFENPDGQRVLVLTNPGKATSSIVRYGGYILELDLAADSVTTLAWS